MTASLTSLQICFNFFWKLSIGASLTHHHLSIPPRQPHPLPHSPILAEVSVKTIRPPLPHPALNSYLTQTQQVLLQCHFISDRLLISRKFAFVYFIRFLLFSVIFSASVFPVCLVFELVGAAGPVHDTLYEDLFCVPRATGLCIKSDFEFLRPFVRRSILCPSNYWAVHKVGLWVFLTKFNRFEHQRFDVWLRFGWGEVNCRD